MSEMQKLKNLAGLHFTKMTGSGNDFIIIDGRRFEVPQEIMPLLAKGACARARSVGADGLLVLHPHERMDDRLGKVDFRWDFFNADGSPAEMCGNAGRCAARYAFEHGLADREMVFDTLAGPIRATLSPKNGEKPLLIKLEMVPPFAQYRDLSLEVGGKTYTMDGINTGVPHAVLLMEDLESVPVRDLGRALRYHPHFAPAGTNVNFASPKDGGLWVRTYERGVEDETLACGTGVTASVLMTAAGTGLESPVNVRVRSGEELKVYFKNEAEGFSEVFLEGPASYVYEGVLNGEAFAWLA